MIHLNRRRFVTGAGALFAASALPLQAAQSRPTNPGHQYTLRGRVFNLDIGQTPVNFTGKPRTAVTVNNSLPSPILRWKEGETVTLNVRNNLGVDSSIHWHGILLPSNMDGVPGLSFAGIKPGETFQYKFKLKQSGTYWYHSHSGFQEQEGMYGAIIVDPAEPDPVAYDREYVVLLSDWSDESPQEIFNTLKKKSHYYNNQERTAGEALAQLRKQGWKGYNADRAMWNEMRMSDRDISDVTGSTYTYLMNGVTPHDGWVGTFRKGEKIRLRVVNAAAMTIFDFRIPGLKMTVVAADGQNVHPVTVDEFRIGAAETYDVIVEPQSDEAYTIFAQTIDRSGYARGTLAPHAEMRADVPAMDAPIILGHGDMGMSHEGHGGHSGHAGHSGHQGMNHDDRGQRNERKHDGHHQNHGTHGGGGSAGADHSGHEHMWSGKNLGRDHYRGLTNNLGPAGHGSTADITHENVVMGPHIDMLADRPQSRINDPGIGLRNNGRKVLTYGMLCSFYKTADPREPSREIQLHLTGNMHRYMWSMNGIRFADAAPLRLKLGERVRIHLVNDTMMNHPVHLHGMWSDLETGYPGYIPRKHTVIVQPGSTASYLVTADTIGRWAYHCHLLYHMPSMAREVRVEA